MAGLTSQLRDVSWTMAELHSGQVDIRALIAHNHAVALDHQKVKHPSLTP
jgi:hypothetical protein